MSAGTRDREMAGLLTCALMFTLMAANSMSEAQQYQSLNLILSELKDGKITVFVKANSPTAQRVVYELHTKGSSSATHKGGTHLKANDTSTLSTVGFSAGEEWCVSLSVQEESGRRYTITKGNACPP